MNFWQSKEFDIITRDRFERFVIRNLLGGLVQIYNFFVHVGDFKWRESNTKKKKRVLLCYYNNRSYVTFNLQ